MLVPMFFAGIAMTAMFAAGANGDFALRVIIDGEDVTEGDTITIDPDETLLVILHFTDVTASVVLQDLFIELDFAGQTVLSETRALGQVNIVEGVEYVEEITIDPHEFLKAGNMKLITGIYGSRFRVTYIVGGSENEWHTEKNIKIPGNPVTTPGGVIGLAAGLTALTSIVVMGKSLAAPAVGAAGTVLPPGMSVMGTPDLKDMILNRLEPTARGRVVGNIVKAAKSRIVRGKCPLCESRLKHGYCFTCKKSTKEVQREYTEKLEDLVFKSGQLIESGQVHTLGEITSKLEIDEKLGTDVIAILKHAKLVKVKRLAHKVMGKAITAGISGGISAIIWVTVGGFAVLSMWVLVGILIAAVAIPLIITKTLQAKAKREARKLKS